MGRSRYYQAANADGRQRGRGVATDVDVDVEYGLMNTCTMLINHSGMCYSPRSCQAIGRQPVFKAGRVGREM